MLFSLPRKRTKNETLPSGSFLPPPMRQALTPKALILSKTATLFLPGRSSRSEDSFPAARPAMIRFATW
jgi:hypothetical protein